MAAQELETRNERLSSSDAKSLYSWKAFKYFERAPMVLWQWVLLIVGACLCGWLLTVLLKGTWMLSRDLES